MTTPPRHLNDEHMRFYEWSGATGDAVLPPARTRRHPWHASYGVLAVLTSLLILNGCDRKGPEQAAAQPDQTVQDRQDMADTRAASPDPAQEAGPALDPAREETGERIDPLDTDRQQP